MVPPQPHRELLRWLLPALLGGRADPTPAPRTAALLVPALTTQFAVVPMHGSVLVETVL